MNFGVGEASFLGSVALVWLLNSMKESNKKKPNKSSSGKQSTSGSTQVGKVMLPKVDLSLFFNRENNEEAFQKECEKLAEVLHLYGAAAVMDPRVDEGYNDVFLDMMERYFALSDGKRGEIWDISPCNLLTQSVVTHTSSHLYTIVYIHSFTHSFIHSFIHSFMYLTNDFLSLSVYRCQTRGVLPGGSNT
jgi:hypothetical protein